MRIDNYRGWADESLPNDVTNSQPVLVPPTFTPTTLIGVDISHYQGNVDFAALKAAGCSFVFIKATEGINYVDPMFATFWKAAKAQGFPRGAYHFFRAKDNLQKQIDWFVKIVGRPQPGDLPPVLDVEVPEDWKQFTVAQRVAMILGWLKAIEMRLGVRPIIYINNPMTNDILGNPAAFKDYILWIAHYTTKAAPAVPRPWTTFTFWQFSETGTIGGITGACDLNRFNGTLADLQRLCVAGLAAEDSTADSTAGTTFLGHMRGWFRRLRDWLGL